MLLYTKFVEHYDHVRDPIKMYFMEKIQILMSQKDTLRALADMEALGVREPEERAKFEVLRQSTIQDMKDEITNNLKESRFDLDSRDQTRKYSYGTMQRMRRKQVDLQMKLDEINRKANADSAVFDSAKDKPAKQKDHFDKVENKKNRQTVAIMNKYTDIVKKNDTAINKN